MHLVGFPVIPLIMLQLTRLLIHTRFSLCVWIVCVIAALRNNFWFVRNFKKKIVNTVSLLILCTYSSLICSSANSRQERSYADTFIAVTRVRLLVAQQAVVHFVLLMWIFCQFLTTSSSAVAKRPRDALYLSVVSFNSTKHGLQGHAILWHWISHKWLQIRP